MAHKDTSPTILIVDDEALFRSSAAEALGVACPHYSVLQAGDGQEALDHIHSTEIDVVVSDVSMPRMDGLELMLALRERRFRGRVIIVTAFGDPRLESEFAQRGAFSYLEKPVDLPQLIDLVRNAAEGEHSQIQGLSLAGFAQLLALERKTCRLRISNEDQHGDLLFRDGVLLDAKVGQLVGDRAALEIFTWDDGARLDLHAGVQAQRTTVGEALSHLLLEAMRQKDEEREESDSLGRSATEELEVEPEGAELEQLLSTGIDELLQETVKIRGAIGIALVDHASGISLGQAGDAEVLDMDIAVGNVGVLRSKMKVIDTLGLDDSIEDILITLGRQYHLIRPLGDGANLFLYLALERSNANLALARRVLMMAEKKLTG